MKFLCLGYFDSEKMGALTKEQLDGLMRQCEPHMKVLYKTGRVFMDAGLETSSKRMRRSRGKASVVDGPFTEAKELVGGAFVIEADDMEDAVRIAALHPVTQVEAGEALGWGLEIRPIDYFASEPKG